MTPAALADLLRKHPRLAITGGPKTGKTTLSGAVQDRLVLHTDDLITGREWSEVSQTCADAVNAMAGPLVVEGVAVPRALRKGMKVDAVLYLDAPHEPLSAGQQSMAKSVWTVLSEWREQNPGVPVYFDTRGGRGAY